MDGVALETAAVNKNFQIFPVDISQVFIRLHAKSVEQNNKITRRSNEYKNGCTWGNDTLRYNSSNRFVGYIHRPISCPNLGYAPTEKKMLCGISKTENRRLNKEITSHTSTAYWLILKLFDDTVPNALRSFESDRKLATDGEQKRGSSLLLLFLLLLLTLQLWVGVGLFNNSIPLLSVLYLRPPTNNFHPL